MSLSRTATARVSAATRREEALAHRLSGKTYWQIRDAMGISQGRAYQLVAEALKMLNESCIEKAQDVRVFETARLDQMMTALQPGIDRGDTKAITAALRVMDRRAKLWGLDQQEKESSLEKALAALLSQPTEPQEGDQDDGNEEE